MSKPTRNRLFRSFASTATLVAVSALWQGCAPMKTVTINTTPDKAALTIFKVPATGGESILPLEPGQTQTPATIPLTFADQTHYRIEAHHVLCIPSLDTTIGFDPQTTYNINLTQYKVYVTGIVNEPMKGADIWQLRPTPVQTVASLDATEPSMLYISQPAPITKNKRTDLDYPSFTASPTAGMMVYEEITPDSSTNTGYSSKLWKLRLQPGENPTLLTFGRRQQRFPAFDFSGENIVFDSNDDSRTDEPFTFKVDENEASVGHLEADPDTLEYSFSIAQNALAFASYGPNATEPEISVSGRDGSGRTRRDSGLSPQLSPDGNSILYIHRPLNGKFRIYKVNTHGPVLSNDLSRNDDMDYFDPHWSPDGRMIVFCSPSRGNDLPDDDKKEPNIKYHDAEGEHSFLWLMSSDGQHVIRLTRNESYDSNPVFDRNGRTIYFRSNRGGYWNIWKLDLTDQTFKDLNVTPPGQ